MRGLLLAVFLTACGARSTLADVEAVVDAAAGPDEVGGVGPSDAATPWPDSGPNDAAAPCVLVAGPQQTVVARDYDATAGGAAPSGALLREV